LFKIEATKMNYTARTNHLSFEGAYQVLAKDQALEKQGREIIHLQKYPGWIYAFIRQVAGSNLPQAHFFPSCFLSL